MTISAFETPASLYCPNCMEPLDEGNTCTHCGSGAQRAPKVVHHLPPGTELADGRYLVGLALGQGGFGITYIGRDLTLNMRVAVKEYYPSSYVGRDYASPTMVVAPNAKAQARLEAGRMRFLDEARVLAKFHNSPGIVDVRDFFEENGTAYIVMDYLEGETLKEYLQHTTMSADQAFALMAPIMDALELVHADHVIHRDISPDNIMLCSDGTLCLMDFGAAHEMVFDDQRSVSMVLKGGYAPEEQYRAKGELGPWTDIYALCATIYRAITGVAPDESLQRLIGDEMAWPSDMGISISPAQENVLRKGMAPRHFDRYQSIAELKHDLASGSGSEQSRNKRRVIPAIIAALCAAAAALALFLFTPAYTVTFDAAGGSAIEPISVNRIQTIDEPAAPNRENYAFAGWYLDDALQTKAEFPLKATADTTLHAAWDKLTASYRVEYRDAADDSEVADAKTVEAADIGSKVTVKAPDIDGYALDSKRKTKLLIAENEDENVVVFTYRKLVTYEVRYLDSNTNADIAPAKTVEGIAEGQQVTETAPDIAGYTLNSESEQTITTERDSSKNVIAFYYDPVPVVQQSYTGNSGGRSSGGGSSSGGKNSNDVKWAN